MHANLCEELLCASKCVVVPPAKRYHKEEVNIRRTPGNIMEGVGGGCIIRIGDFDANRTGLKFAL